MRQDLRSPWERLENAVDSHQPPAAIAQLLNELGSNEMPRIIARLDAVTCSALLEALEPQQAAELLEHLPEVQAAEMIEDLDPTTAGTILDSLTTREQVDILDELDKSEVRGILETMTPAAVQSIRDLAAFPEGTAGSMMEPEVLAFEGASRVNDVVRDLQRNSDIYRDFQVQYVHVVQQGRLEGVVPLRSLLLNSPDTRLEELALSDLVSLPAEAPLEDVETAFEEHDFLGLPVVGSDGQLLGLVRRSGLEHAIAERSESDYRYSQGIVGGEELRSMPYLLRARRRLSWLSINVFLNIAAASVIALYQDTLSAVIALAAFLPIISDMSGCSGNQAVAVSMRELALGIADPRDVWSVWRREAVVALMNGTVLGVMLGAVAFLWQQNLYLSLVVGGALAVNTLIAVSLGGVIPLVLKRFELDPAVASGPILTTVTDLCGFLLTLSLATVWLAQLSGAA